MSDDDTIEPAASVHPGAGAAAAGSPVLIHIWEMLNSEQQGVIVERIDDMLGEVANHPGFVSARVLESADRSSIATIVEMQSAEDRERLEQLPVVRSTLTHLSGAVNIITRRYHETRRYQAGGASA